MKKHPKLVIFTYVTLILGVFLVWWLFPNNNYKLIALAAVPLIAWLPLDIKWIQNKSKERKERKEA